MDDLVRIERGVFDRLLADARANPNIECCGLLAGRDAVISAILPAKNALQSPKAYEIAPQELFDLFRRIRSERLEHLGIYHSHPNDENDPSPLDIERAFYPDSVYLIISMRPAASRPIRAFRIVEGQARELSLQIIGA
jgi:proteasome lid subunit RPN8/RPN11